MSAMTAVPTHADPGSDLPPTYIGAYGVHDTHDLVSRYAWVSYAGEYTELREGVATANSAGVHFESNLPGTRSRDIALDQLEGAIWTRNLYCSHA
jgi:hypothetical protein